jgi:hypothetical protein
MLSITSYKGSDALKLLAIDWNIVLFTGSSLLHDYWVTLGLPQVYYLTVDDNETKRNKQSPRDESDDKIA